MKRFLFILLAFNIYHQVYTQVNSRNNMADVYTAINKNTLSDKLFGLSKVWSEIKYNFVNIDKIKFDIDSLYYSTISKVSNTINDIEYYDELQRFIASFNDAHTELLTRTYSWNDYIPANIIEIDKKLYFSSIKKMQG